MPSRDPAGLLERARAAPPSAELAARAVGLVDLTSLSGEETAGEIEALAARAVRYGTAAICIYPTHLRVARVVLAGSGVRLATVANFPVGGDDIAGTADAVAAAVAEGADEVDIVAPIDAILGGDVGVVGELVESCRTAAGSDTVLKLILETGQLVQPQLIAAASRAAVMAGIDFLKTSTGKTPVGATLEAAAVMLAVIDEAGGKVGFKAAGGVRTTTDAAAYLHLVDELLGADWVSPRHVRFGASSLLDDLLQMQGLAMSGGAKGSY